MLDAITSLAFSMHSNPGVYALLLGSGISRSAQIPTGWDITLELVRKIATIDGTQDLPVGAAEAWYSGKFNEAPDYAKLLDRLAKTQPERQQVLKSYIEPNDVERDQGHKLPTAAHRAIAKLVAAGKVRVIITTNFDQLLEAALRDEGVVPTVIASADAANGAVPLVHSTCTVIKIHGDYMDTRIRNTPAELEKYDPALDRILDRVFDEFGLIVCGWSADWDVALKAALMRTPTRRYSMYWAARGAPGAAAKALIEHRGMSQIAIEGADPFFSGLQAKVAALDAFNAPHPMSAEIGVTLLKQYLAEDRHRIALDDLVRGETRRLLQAIESGDFSLDPRGTMAGFEEQTQHYEALCATLMPMVMVAGQWSRGEQMRPWIDAIQTLCKRAENKSGSTSMIDLRRWPASLLLHAFGIGALAQERESELGPLLTCAIDSFGEAWCAGDRLNAGAFFEAGQNQGQHWAAYGKNSQAVTSRLYDVLKPIGVHVLRDVERLERAFVGLELVMAMGFAERKMPAAVPGQPAPHFWVPTGRYLAKRQVREAYLQRWKDAPDLLRHAAGLKQEPRLAELERFLHQGRGYF
jgi:hypothetical protein